MAGTEDGVLNLDVIRAAAARIAAYVAPTPMIAMTPTGLNLKAENLHPMGAFKLRGAFNAILSLSPEEKRRGVVAHSSGNHAQAVAYAAVKFGVKAVVVMPDNASRLKLDATRSWGAEVVQVNSKLRSETCQALAREHGYAVIEPYDSLAIMAGTGTIGLEILEQCPEVNCVTVPISGGGLLGGLSTALKQLRPGIRVIGVEPELASDAHQSFRAGRLISVPQEETVKTIADGLRVSQLGNLTWRQIQANVDDIITVSEAAIKQAMRRVAAEARLVAEPSGAVSVAGALQLGRDWKRMVAVVSGGNMDLASYAAILAETD